MKASFAVEDATNDGLADIIAEGGTYGAVGAGPPRAFRNG